MTLWELIGVSFPKLSRTKSATRDLLHPRELATSDEETDMPSQANLALLGWRTHRMGTAVQ